jgi:molybdopterin-guanine dinucleotide biosynthesis protein B
MHENRGAPEPTLEELVARLTPVDLVIVEGFKRHAHPKLEVHRTAVGKPLLCSEDEWIVAVASDTPLGGLSIPVLQLDDVAGIADFILARCGFGGR